MKVTHMQYVCTLVHMAEPTKTPNDALVFQGKYVDNPDAHTKIKNALVKHVLSGLDGAVDEVAEELGIKDEEVRPLVVSMMKDLTTMSKDALQWQLGEAEAAGWSRNALAVLLGSGHPNRWNQRFPDVADVVAARERVQNQRTSEDLQVGSSLFTLHPYE